MAPEGGFVVTGSFTETVLLAPGTPEATLKKTALEGQTSSFVASFSAQRRLRWVRLVHNTPGATRVRVLPDGSVVITCEANPPTQVEAGPDTLHEIPRVRQDEHSSQFHVIRWDAAGMLSWVRSFAGQVQSSHHGLKALPDGSVLAWGHLSGRLRVYPLEQGGVLESPPRQAERPHGSTATTAMIRIAPDGTKRWLRTLDWTAPLVGKMSAGLPDGTVVLAGTWGGSTQPGANEPDRVFLAWIRPEDGSTERVVQGRSVELPRAPGPGDPAFRLMHAYPVRLAALPDGSTAMAAYFSGGFVVDERLPDFSTLQSGGDLDLALALFSRSGALRWARVSGSSREDGTLCEHLRADAEGVHVYGTAGEGVTFARGKADARTYSVDPRATPIPGKYRVSFGGDGALVALEPSSGPPPLPLHADCCQRTSWLSLRKERPLPTRNPPRAPELQAWLDQVLGRVELGWTPEDKVDGLLGPGARKVPQEKNPYWDLPSVTVPGGRIPLLRTLQADRGLAMYVVVHPLWTQKEVPSQEEVRRAFEPLPRDEFKAGQRMDQYCHLPGHPGVVMTVRYTPDGRLFDLTLGGVEGQGCATPEQARAIEETNRQLEELRKQRAP